MKSKKHNLSTYILIKSFWHNILIAVVFTTTLIPLNASARGPMPGVTSDSKFIVYYGNDYYTGTENGAPASSWRLNPTVINSLAQFDIVVLQTNRDHLMPEVVHELKSRGVDTVLGYISIGEESVDESINSLLTGSGMLVYNSSTNSLVLSVGNTLQSFYMDVDSQRVIRNLDTGKVESVHTTQRLTPDNKPDYNENFLGLMINPDNNWRWVLDNMRIDSPNVFDRTTKAGLKQLSGNRNIHALRTRSGNFGFDGFFLDTIDTAGPYNVKGSYPWVVENMRDTVKYISDSYPSKVVFANRGLFYFSAGLKSTITGQFPIDFTIRPYVNAVLFESFRYGSNGGPVSEFYNENRFNIAPKVLAEANRRDGFSVFSLEYESGRSNIVDDAFNTDIRKFGFTSYLADDKNLDTINVSFLNRLPDSVNDTSAPTWDTTGQMAYNTATTDFRVGVQHVSQGSSRGEISVHWDVAVDQSYPVTYDVLITDVARGFTTNHSQVRRKTGSGWTHDPANKYANQYTITDLPMDRLYNIRIVARDALGNKNTDDPGFDYYLTQAISNPILSTRITLDGLLSEWGSITGLPSDPDDMVGVSPAGHISGAGNQANWRQIQVAHTTDSNQLFLGYTNTSNIYISWGFQVFIDADDNPNTGFQGGFGGIANFPIGADYLIEGVRVHKYAGRADGTDWNWITSPATNGFEVGRVWSGSTGEVFLPLSWIGNPSDSFSFVLFGNNKFYGHPGENDWYPDNAVNGGYFRYKF